MKKSGMSIVVALLVVLVACGGEPDRETGEEAARRAAEDARRAAEEAGRAVDDARGIADEALSAARRAVTGGRNVEPVDGATLQNLLPTSLDGLERTNVANRRDGAMGFFVSTATAEYAGDGTIEVSIVDLGGVSNPATLGYAWSEVDVDRKWSDGYERTVAYRGYRAHETYDGGTRTGEMAVIVADRFIVAVDGADVAPTAIKDALARVDLDRLAAMRESGVEPAAPERR